ncbi:MAG: sensor histidine kinase [Paracoccaceae bacterium]|nr:sensor histidine kinase [Paracoccaceae bacterium]
MKAVSKLDISKVGRADPPDIILGEDWEERARSDETEESTRPPSEGGRWIHLNRSPLARKIITFNLLALVVLVGGVLYLNQFREGLVEQRKKSLVVEAQLIARVVAAEAPTDQAQMPDERARMVGQALKRLDIPDGVGVYLFDKTETLITKSHGSPIIASDARAKAPYGTFITGFLNAAWEKVTGVLGSLSSTRVVGAEELARRVVPHALAGKTVVDNVTDARGDPLFAVATPVEKDGKVLGALVVTTAAGEISEMARNEREQVLQMFLVAILVSIGLSLVLAGTIANPLRDLAMAAELGRSKNARKMSPGKVRIPDMTARPDEIGRLSGALRGMVAALYDRIDSNEEFAADVSHELKNPLTSLRSAVETLRVVRDEEKLNRLLDVIEQDVRRMDRLVSDISNASRLDAELVKEEMEVFDLVKMLDLVVEHQRLEAAERGIEFIADFPSEPIMMRGLESRLAQVVVNLLSNAISFCEEGDAIRIWARKRDKRVLIVVEDTGPGIPEEALTKIFKRFYSDRSKDFGKHSGLGLAISRQIVEAHGGVIWAENIRPTPEDVTSEPMGARFVVGLPG